LDSVISFTRRKAVVKTEICTRPAVDKWRLRVTGPGPVTGFGNSTTTEVADGVEVRVGVRLLTAVLVCVAEGVNVPVEVKTGVIVGVGEAVEVEVFVGEAVGVLVLVNVEVTV
jgi:hypothetical protein